MALAVSSDDPGEECLFLSVQTLNLAIRDALFFQQLLMRTASLAEQI